MHFFGAYYDAHAAVVASFVHDANDLPLLPPSCELFSPPLTFVKQAEVCFLMSF